MAIVTLLGSRVVTGFLASPRTLANPGLANGRIHVWSETVEVGSADSATSTYHMARLASNIRLLGASRIWWDDLASAGSPTLDIGLFNPSGFSGITNDDDAINVDLDAATVNSAGISLVKAASLEKFGLRLWELVNGQTTDPQQPLDVFITLKDADVNVGGTIMCEFIYTYE
jgi:hypothetical protein